MLETSRQNVILQDDNIKSRILKIPNSKTYELNRVLLNY